MPSSPRRGSAVVPALAATRDAGARAGAAPSLSPPERLVVLAPNWLGDAVMALPLVADLRRSWPSTRIVVAARRSVAPLYGMVPGVDGTVVLEGAGGRSALHEAQANARRLREGAFDAALLLPNSFLAAWLAWRAGVRERWGFARDMRGRLLTRAIPRPRRYGHQVEYYQALAASLGLGPGEPFAAVHVPDAARARADDVLRSAGAAEGRPLVVFAPGAAYGRAKQWRPDRFAELASRLAADGIDTVLVGAKGDVDVCREIAASAPA